jgi:branched-chain amino acid transport system permease protein
MDVFLQQTFNGLVIGSVYILAALGLTLIYGILVQINFAQGEILMISAFAGYFAATLWKLDYLLTIVLATLLGAALGVLLERVAFRPLRHASALAPLVATIGISLALQNLARVWWTADPRQFSTVYLDQIIRIGALSFSAQRLIVLVLSGLTIAGLYYMIQRTYVGKALRATSQDSEVAGLMGIDVNQVILITFAIGGALAGTAGALLGPLLVVQPFMGGAIMLKAFAIVILGGFGNVQGTILAGFILGLIESYITGYLIGSWVDIAVFALLVAMLAIRPTGLIAERVEENV